ncbi:cytochrome P450 [Emcibacter sp.]|uniref:cytochrome P450 n=1 Tax=Emcibacter sp. TaxID=1979954 RepID=UPI003A8F509D
MRIETPPHVNPEQVVDFDFYHPCEAGGDPFLAWKTLQDGPEMVWTPHNGGHWIATRGEQIKELLTDWNQFSSSCAFIPPSPDRPRGLPLEYDPPEHTPLKRMLAPAFLPKAIRHWSEEARNLAVELIEGFRDRGKCEFIEEFAQQLPIIIFLRILDLPEEDRKPLLDSVNTNLRPASEEARAKSRAFMNDYIDRLIKDRRENPREEILSAALMTEIDGKLLDDDMARGLTSGLLGGGLDTVASSMGWMAMFLAQNPGHRRQLIDDPLLIPNAVQEMLRRFSIPNIARVVREDMEYHGASLKAGEQVLMSGCLHAMDPEIFADPMTVDFTRKNAPRHMSYSTGIHRCIGAQLANQELGIFLEEWLARIPDFGLDPEDPPEMVTGIAHGINRLPLIW